MYASTSELLFIPKGLEYSGARLEETSEPLLAVSMAAKKLYPRSTIRRIIKAHSNRSISKNVDVLVSNPRIYIYAE